MISLALNITSLSLTLESVIDNKITLSINTTSTNLTLSIDRGVSLETVKADSDIVDTIVKKHTQNTDQYLDLDGDNEVSAAQSLTAYNHSQSAHAPSNAQKNVQSDWDQADDTKDDFIKNKPTTPEFSNVVIPALNTTAESGGEISTTLWAWIKSVFATIVAKSVKSFIIGAFTVLKDHATRIELMEDKYVLKYVVPADTSSIDLTTDRYGNAFNFVECDKFDVIIDGGTSVANVNVWLRLNNVSSLVYVQSSIYSGFLGIGNYFWNQIYSVQLTSLSAICNIFIQRSTSDFVSNAQNVYTMATKDNSISLPITSVNIICSSGVIKAGTIILIKKK